MKFQIFSKSIWSNFDGKQTNYKFFWMFFAKYNKFLKFWGYKRQKRIKTRFSSSILIFTIFGQKSPKIKIFWKNLLFSTRKNFWVNAQKSDFVQLYSYIAQNIRSALLSKVLKKKMKQMKNETFILKKPTPPKL